MALSPGVETREQSISTFLRGVGTSDAASVGEYEWGPINEPFHVTDTNSLLETLHKPSNARYVDWFAAFNFLSYSNSLWLTRVADNNTARNAKLTGTSVLIENSRAFNLLMEGASLNQVVLGRYPGELANHVRVIIVDAFTYKDLPSKYANVFSGAPSTSTYAKTNNASNDELHVAVIDDDGYVTGNAGAVLEKWEFVSKARDGKFENGNEAYWMNVINRESKYIYASNTPATTPGGKGILSIAVTKGGSNYTYADVTIVGDGSGAKAVAEIANGEITEIIITNKGTGYVTAPTVTITGDGVGATATATLGNAEFDDAFGIVVRGTNGTSFVNMTAIVNSVLSGGTSGDKASIGDFMNGWLNYQDTERFSTQLYFLGSGHSDEARHIVAKHAIDNVAEYRKDCLLAHSPRLTDVKNQTQSQAFNNVARFYTLTRSDSSFSVRDTGWKTQYDPYNDVIRWIPLDADIAGLCANTDAVADLWWSPAGKNRGKIKNVIDLAWSPNKPTRDLLYPLSINSIISTVSDGVVLMGDRTGQLKETPFSYINVRRLFNMLKRKIGNAAETFLFEFNDVFSRNQFINMVEPELETIQSRRGITAYKVVCDDTNNTAAIVDRGEFVGTILIKPARSINFIRLNFVAVGNSVTFEEAATIQF
jgi:hypothetical protein